MTEFPRPIHPILVLILLLPFLWLGAWPLIDPDEARTAEVGREMLASGDWIVPTINGLPRLDKPLIPYAATAISLRVFGMTPFAVRFPAALSVSLTCLFVALSLRRDIGPERATLAAAMTASAPLMMFWSRGGTIDAILLLWMTIAFISFWRSMQDDGRLAWSVAAWIALALGVLTKGPVALLPLAVAVSHALIRRRGVRRLFPIPGIVAAIALVVPWVLAVLQRYPDFLEYVVSVETVARTTTTDLHRTGPMVLPLATLLLGTLPWMVMLIRGLFHADTRRTLRASVFARYLALWILLPLVLFTLVSSRRPQYVLPLVPAVALAVSLLWPSERRIRRTGGIAAMVAGTLLVAATPFGLRDELPLSAVLSLSIAGGVSWIATGLMVMRERVILATLILSLFPLTMIPLLIAQGERQGGSSTAAELRRRGLADAPIYGLHTWSPSIAFDLRRAYPVITHHGRELGGNYINRHYATLVDAPDSPLRSRGWYERNLDTCEQPMIVIARSDDRSTLAHIAERSMPILFRTNRFVVAQACGRAAATN